MDSAPKVYTFLFTDIEGSTRLAQTRSEEYGKSLDLHNKKLYEAIESNGGFVFRVVGDAFCAAFDNAGHAINAAVAAQLLLRGPDEYDLEIKVRMGIHSGKAEWNGEHFSGYVTLAKTNRVMSAGYGGQILVSEDSRNLCTDNSDSNVTFRDLGVRRLKDLITPTRVFQVVVPGLRADFPPIKTLDIRPNNLPIQLTSFIGREKETGELKELISGSRFVTLLGPGGTGKTRMALQAGAEMIDDFRDGVHFAGLASVTDPMFIPNTVAKELQLDLNPGKDPGAELISRLKGKELLLILDNCEHLISDAAKTVTALLSQIKEMKILCTSREVMKCDGEMIFSVMPLSIPEEGRSISPAELLKIESVRLFVERTLLVAPGFRVNEDNANDLAMVCRRLEGIPLAIELAAARMKAMSLKVMLQRLDDRFRLLTGGKRNALPRQQTLRALLDWSYDLLSENSKILLKRTSLFAGGFDLNSANVICSDENIMDYDILDILHDLVEKSLLNFDPGSERYSMLETIRQYGLEKYAGEDDAEAVRGKHFAYFRNLAEETEPRMREKEQAKYLNLTEREHSNMLSALEWGVSVGRIDDAARIAIGISRFWNIRGYVQTADKWYSILTENRDRISPDIRGRVLNYAGDFHQYSGDHDGTLRLLKDAVECSRLNGNTSWTASSLNSLGAMLAKRGDYSGARSVLAECLGIARQVENNRTILGVLCNLSQLDILLSDFDSAESFIRECLDLSRESGDSYYIYLSERNAGQIAAIRGNLTEALDYYGRALNFNKEIGFQPGISVILTELAELNIALGNIPAARELLEESSRIAAEAKDTLCRAMAANAYGNAEFESANIEKATAFFKEGLALFGSIDGKDGIALALSGLGLCEMARSEFQSAKEHFLKSRDLMEEIRYSKELPNVMLQMADAEDKLGNTDRARELVKNAAEMIAASGLTLTGRRKDLHDMLVEKFSISDQ